MYEVQQKTISQSQTKSLVRYILTLHAHAQLLGEVESFYDDLDERFPWLAFHSRVSKKKV